MDSVRQKSSSISPEYDRAPPDADSLPAVAEILPSVSEIDRITLPFPPTEATSRSLIASRTAFGVAAFPFSDSDDPMLPCSWTTPVCEVEPARTVKPLSDAAVMCP